MSVREKLLKIASVTLSAGFRADVAGCGRSGFLWRLCCLRGTHSARAIDCRERESEAQ